ncbi:class I SAM-dependent methyltransferase [Antarcticibacterium flavum]|uniref:Class I SAM-dependent methyltransferase n=1 Tax=Antarcticibacterium flavum TaxID=2058175 RepID=A0A5B7X5C3_9FLAO|nr:MULTISPECIES: class I SAM-dependent methyltransferase [Antarcticibacterium]MCM4159712.1 SAM-dependent methyltransferase [Antarcticibacterium sp. W02-3]QCY70646.1 class I SAM-dependent methyltransferase [Antarcticibacterium flavum]
MKKHHSDQYKDIFGRAIKAYYNEKDTTNITVHSPDFDDDIIPVEYLFRNFEQMPVLEQKALGLCSGKVLDVGCGAGSHGLFLQNERSLQVTGIDISPGAVEIASQRGLKDARQLDYFNLKTEKFDTILFLMNGTGIIGRLNKLDEFFSHTRSLLNAGGKVLLDSSDLRFLYDEDEEGGIWVDLAAGYYGELKFRISYKDEVSEEFDWLYLDFDSLELAAAKNRFSCTLLQKGEHYDYLAELKPL